MKVAQQRENTVCKPVSPLTAQACEKAAPGGNCAELVTLLSVGTNHADGTPDTDGCPNFHLTCNVDRLAASELDRSILPISDCGEAMLPLQSAPDPRVLLWRPSKMQNAKSTRGSVSASPTTKKGTYVPTVVPLEFPIMSIVDLRLCSETIKHHG